MKQILVSFLFLFSIISLIALAWILKRDPWSRSCQGMPSRSYDLEQFFPNRRIQTIPLIERASGRWVVLYASKGEIDKFVEMIGATILPFASSSGESEEMQLDDKIQFELPSSLRYSWSRRSLVIRGSVGAYGLHGFFEPTDGRFLICLYK